MTSPADHLQQRHDAAKEEAERECDHAPDDHSPTSSDVLAEQEVDSAPNELGQPDHEDQAHDQQQANVGQNANLGLFHGIPLLV